MFIAGKGINPILGRLTLDSPCVNSVTYITYNDYTMGNALASIFFFQKLPRLYQMGSKLKQNTLRACCMIAILILCKRL